MWQVPSRGIKAVPHARGWLVGSVVVVALSGVSVGLVRVIHLPMVGLLSGLLLGFIAGTGLFFWTQFSLANVKVPWQAHVPGALVGGVFLTLFQLLGAYLLPLVMGGSKLYASLGVAVALLAVFMLFARILVLATVISVLRWENGHGTVSLMIPAPAIPGGAWAVAERAGQRPKPKRRKKPKPSATG